MGGGKCLLRLRPTGVVKIKGKALHDTSRSGSPSDMSVEACLRLGIKPWKGVIFLQPVTLCGDCRVQNS